MSHVISILFSLAYLLYVIIVAVTAMLCFRRIERRADSRAAQDDVEDATSVTSLLSSSGRSSEMEFY